MRIGMLWVDQKAGSLEEKVSRAAEYYRRKYGETPNVCFVNPRDLAEPVNVAAGIEVKPWQYIQRGALWIGISERK